MNIKRKTEKIKETNSTFFSSSLNLHEHFQIINRPKDHGAQITIRTTFRNSKTCNLIGLSNKHYSFSVKVNQEI